MPVSCWTDASGELRSQGERRDPGTLALSETRAGARPPLRSVGSTACAPRGLPPSGPQGGFSPRSLRLRSCCLDLVVPVTRPCMPGPFPAPPLTSRAPLWPPAAPATTAESTEPSGWPCLAGRAHLQVWVLRFDTGLHLEIRAGPRPPAPSTKTAPPPHLRSGTPGVSLCETASVSSQALRRRPDVILNPSSSSATLTLLPLASLPLEGSLPYALVLIPITSPPPPLSLRIFLNHSQYYLSKTRTWLRSSSTLQDILWLLAAPKTKSEHQHGDRGLPESPLLPGSTSGPLLAGPREAGHFPHTQSLLVLLQATRLLHLLFELTARSLWSYALCEGLRGPPPLLGLDLMQPDLGIMKDTM